ncbi:hypothetical protein B0H13DRAFT_1869876 [Mycena leptocephala]|nr:hypothetical protein B0H13DRAFT_1869876 [Mycena leptocephala]
MYATLPIHLTIEVDWRVAVGVPESGKSRAAITPPVRTVVVPPVPHREADGKNGPAGEETPNLEVNELEPGRMPGVVGMQNSSWDVCAVGSIRQPEIRGPLGPCEELKLKGVPSCCFFAQSFRSAE